MIVTPIVLHRYIVYYVLYSVFQANAAQGLVPPTTITSHARILILARPCSDLYTVIRSFAAKTTLMK